MEPQVVPKVVPKATAQFRVKPKASAAVQKVSSSVTAAQTEASGLKRSRADGDEGEKEPSKTGAATACNVSPEGDGLAGLLGGYGSDDSGGV